MVPHIELSPRRGDLHDGRADYAIYAGELNVGSIYETYLSGKRMAWLWSVAVVINDNRNGVKMGGMSDDLEEAKRQFRIGFEGWLAWALDQPESHLSYASLDTILRKMGARSE